MTQEEQLNLILGFQNYANSFGSGYIKPWKASTMVGTLIKLPIINDKARLISYLENCLMMEGFRKTDIVLVADWLRENFSA